MTTPGDGAVAAEPGPRFATAVKITIAGAVLAVPCLLIVAFALFRGVTGPTIEVPGSATMQLGAGRYLVFERTGSSRSIGPVTVSNDRGFSVGPGNAHVIGPDGVEVPLSTQVPNETITRGQDRYNAAVAFETPKAGRYTLQVAQSAPGRVMVARPFGYIFQSHAKFVAGGAVGALVGFAGVGMMVIGGVRRSRYRRAQGWVATGPTTVPAGWYADPHGRARLRWWDGATWSEHTAD